MGLPTSIATLLSGEIVETARIEFKETWGAQASLKTICAFANDIDNWGGGYIVIGVREEDDGTRTLKGVPTSKVDAWQKDILNKCKLIQPEYTPITEVDQHEGMTFMVIWAPGGSQRPYSSPKSMGKKSERILWIRKMSSTIRPNHEEERELYNLANNVPFDDRVNHEAEVSDLNLPLIKAYLREVGSSLYERADTMDFVALCRNMNIVEGPSEYTKPKNVGLLFFSDNPERFFPCAHIEIVELPDGEGGDRIYERTFRGPLHQQLRDALLFIQNNIIEETVTKVPGKAESQRHFNYPFAAIEEALANAVYHKGYDTREPIEVRILPDRIEILSHPGADRSISIANLKQYRAVSRRYRNRRVGEFLKELRLTEGRNTGIHKMLRAMKENGSPDPLLETDDDRIYFLTTLYARIDDDVSGRRERTSRHVSERRQRLLAFFQQSPHATLMDAAVELGVAQSTINRDVAALKRKGALAHHGPNKGGLWVIEP